MKKMEAINLLVKRLDLTAEDVVKNWIAQGVLDSTVFTKEEKTSVQKSFEELKLAGIEEKVYCWSSSEYGNTSSSSAWVVRPSDGLMVRYGKRSNYTRVRCVLDFQF